MIVGIPKEIKTEEFRVAITPAGARELTDGGHTVLIETGAGIGSGFADEEYRKAEPIWSQSSGSSKGPISS